MVKALLGVLLGGGSRRVEDPLLAGFFVRGDVTGWLVSTPTERLAHSAVLGRGNMVDLKLFTSTGAYVATVQVPPWKYPPELYQWGERFFIYRRSPHRFARWYTEVDGFVVVPPGIANYEHTVTEQ